MLMQDTLHDLGCADTAASFDDALEKAATCGLDVAHFDVNEHRKQTFPRYCWRVAGQANPCTRRSRRWRSRKCFAKLSPRVAPESSVTPILKRNGQIPSRPPAFWLACWYIEAFYNPVSCLAFMTSVMHSSSLPWASSPRARSRA
jgi:hypothetical protein